MNSFFIYEEYGATYETMLTDLSMAAKSIPNWDSYQRGFEILTNMVASGNQRALGNHKGLTVDDLLIKVMQTSHVSLQTPAKFTHSPYSEYVNILCSLPTFASKCPS